MEFKSGKSYFCKKSYGEDYYNKVNQMNQFLMYTQPKTRYGGVSYDYNMEMAYYGYGNDEVYKTPVPRFTAGSIYRCMLGGSLVDDRGLFISLSQIDPDDFMEIELNLGDSTKEIMSKLGAYGIGFEVLPEKVIGGELKDGVIENPDLSITVFKVRANRVGSFLRGGRLSAPSIIEMESFEAGDNLSDTIDKAVYNMWKKIRIQSAWCSAIRRTLNYRLNAEKEKKEGSKPRVYTINSSYLSSFYT
jgi:hypothetical protein